MARILIVEDDEQVRVLAESILQEHGHTTLSADTLEQAIALPMAKSSRTCFLPTSNYMATFRPILFRRKKPPSVGRTSVRHTPRAGDNGRHEGFVC
jgi:hypothetical protein